MVDRLSRSLSLPRVQAAFLVSFGSLTLFVLLFSLVYGSSERLQTVEESVLAGNLSKSVTVMRDVSIKLS